MSPSLTQMVAAERLRDLRITDGSGEQTGVHDMYFEPRQASSIAALGLVLGAATYSLVLVMGVLG